jgi:release factor glutamine methyltransferase
MHLQQAQQQLLVELKALYHEREAATIADWVMEKVTGLKKIDRILGKNQELAAAEEELLKKWAAELATHRPVQYVLQESWFCGLPFYVDEHVLIPRPETEELVEWLVEEAITQPGQPEIGPPYSVLDVGTGSGCIAISVAVALKKRLRPISPGVAPMAAAIYACDISTGALAVARRNAATHQTPIEFRQLDFLDAGQRSSLPSVQAIISNPPYIPIAEKSGMAPHVAGFEPHLALFVADNDPLLFYKVLAAFAIDRLLPGGAVFMEIHEALAAGVIQLFHTAGFPHITLKKDMQGRDRMIKATR